jgi:hypothetical protein
MAKARDPNSAFYDGIPPEVLKQLDDAVEKVVAARKGATEVGDAYDNSGHLTFAEADAEFQRRRKELGVG